MCDDDGPGPLTYGSAPGAAKGRPASGTGHYAVSLLRFGGGHPVDDRVDERGVAGLLRRHEEIALAVAFDLLHLAAAVLGVDPDHRLSLAEQLASMDLDVGGLALHALRPGLVDQDLGVRQRH